MARVTVRVDHNAIDSMFRDTGEIGRAAGRTVREARLIAQRIAPKRTHALSESVMNYSNHHYTYGHRMALYTDLYYARWVLEGTKGPIVAKHISRKGGPGWLIVPARPFGASSYVGYRFRRSVRGQKANPFMQRAMEEACGQRGLMVVL